MPTDANLGLHPQLRIQNEFSRQDQNEGVIILGTGVTKCDIMSNPMVHAFFVGRALATALAEQLEQATTEALSNLGKFDAEQRESLRRFTDEVVARAQQQEVNAYQQTSTAAPTATPGATGQDLQATIDNLRAEIAQVRSTLQQYRASLN